MLNAAIDSTLLPFAQTRHDVVMLSEPELGYCSESYEAATDALYLVTGDDVSCTEELAARGPGGFWSWGRSDEGLPPWVDVETLCLAPIVNPAQERSTPRISAAISEPLCGRSSIVVVLRVGKRETLVSFMRASDRRGRAAAFVSEVNRIGLTYSSAADVITHLARAFVDHGADDGDRFSLAADIVRAYAI